MSTHPIPPAEDDSYPAQWLTPSQSAAVQASRSSGLETQLDQLDDGPLLEVLTRVLSKRQG